MEKEIAILFDKYVRGAASEEEKKRLITWIQANKSVWNSMENEFLSASEDMDSRQQERILQSIHQQLNVRKTSLFRRSTFVRIAAMIVFPLLIAGLAFAFLFSPDDAVQYITIEAQRGQKTHVALPDGSKVYLNSESELVYGSDYNRKERRLKLDGEAYFEVARNEEVPFVVEAGQMEVQAVGTAFNIFSYAEKSLVHTTLTEGKVKVTSLGKTVFLEQNEQVNLDVNSGTMSVRKLDDAKKIIGWLDNQLYFENATFAEISEVLGRIYNIDICFATEELKEYRFSGTISNNSLESVFRILSLTSPIRYEIKDGHVELFEIPQQTKYFQ